MDDLWTHSLGSDWNPPSQTVDSDTNNNRFPSLTVTDFLMQINPKNGFKDFVTTPNGLLNIMEQK